jgi:hypothetical protein
MPRRHLRAAAAAFCTLGSLPAPAAGQSTTTDCSVVAPHPARTFAVALGDGARATVRDLHGGAFQRNRLPVRWTVRISGFAHEPPVTAAEFVVDGRMRHTDHTPRVREGRASLQWAVPSRRFSAGDHVLRIRLRGPKPREIEIPFQATECPFAAFSGAALRRPRPLAVLTWASAQEGPGPPLSSVAATLQAGATLAAPRARPGAAVGSLATNASRRTLRASRSGSVLLADGELRVTLDAARRRVAVSGLPEGVTRVLVRLSAGILRVSRRCTRARFEAELRGIRGDVASLESRDARRC